MKKVEENFLNSNVFLFNSYSCVAQAEQIYQLPGEAPVENVKIYSDKYHPVHFAFGSKVGLVRLNEDGSAAEINILGKLLAIDHSKIENYFDFFKRNGFLLPISYKESDIIGQKELQIIINRLQATLQLLSTITDMSKTSYEKIVRMIMYLLFSPIVHIETKNGKYRYTSTKNPYTLFLENALDLKRDDNLTDIFNNTEFAIKDSITEMRINAQLIEDMFVGNAVEDKYEQDLYRRVFFIYCSQRENIQTGILKINDFLFHYFTEVGLIDHVDLDKTFYYRNEVNKENFSEELKAAAISVAKIIIKYEIENNLSRIRVTYDIQKMQPAWKIDSLLSALYFGLFYMRPSMETYRRCANPKCNEFFLVSLSSTHKKYCCKACQNREMAARKRARDKLLASSKE